MKKIVLFSLLFSLGFTFAKAQGIGYDITYSTPMIFNPALAGTAGAPRNIVAYSLDHNNLENGSTNYYNVFYASYDQYIEKVMGGVGVVFQNSSSALGDYNKYYMGLAYSPTLIIKEKMTFKPVVQFCYGSNNIPQSKITTIDGPSSTANFFDLNLGFFAYCERLYGGMIVKHLTQPNLSNFKTKVEKSPMVYSASFGGVIGDISEEEGFRFSPNAVFDLLNNSSENLTEEKLTVCADFKYKLAKIGIHYEDNITAKESRYNVMAGIEMPRFSLIYSFSANTEASSNTKHQIGLVYKVKSKKEHERVKKLNLVDL